jgi:truncated hemoglobin YjbI
MNEQSRLTTRLEAAVASARRLRGHPVHPETFKEWRRMLHEARDELHTSPNEQVGILISTLECEMSGVTVR